MFCTSNFSLKILQHLHSFVLWSIADLNTNGVDSLDSSTSWLQSMYVFGFMAHILHSQCDI
jgi:hypothetical protein